MFKLLAMFVLAACTSAIAAPEGDLHVRSNTSSTDAAAAKGRAQAEALSPIVQALLTPKPEKKEIKKDNK
ncbi:hypothetical protein [Pseudomonas carnis]|jgi:hypothetical protein|uniref:hypothetical protein n=1 Tax=Pseudomonas carnis TaxID=2487355 RepID=UPI0018E86000|nr:hypothetical protein [Pseudomonas carnis]MBJ2202956.1 hypothetical protein [Pseudomonas carnis]